MITHKSQPLLLLNIGQLLTLRSDVPSAGPRRGAQLRELGIIEDAAVLCNAGKIVSVGTTKQAQRDAWIRKHRKKIIEMDCRRRVVIPGFVDSHTHPAFISPRLVDFEKRISGATYEEIAEAGGGIRSSVDAVRKATKKALAAHVLRGFKEMAEHGTTTVEAKSGYGLSVKAELKSLEAIKAAAACWPGTVVSTLLGAHVVPREYRDKPKAYVDAVCKEMIPRVAQRKLAAFVDVFTDRGAFSVEDTQTVFAAATKYKLGVRSHVCQLTRCTLDPLLQFDPASLDHMDHVSDEDIRKLATRNTVATLVPGANYFLGLDVFPPARKLIDAGVPIALATDYNPGSSPTPSMPFVLSLACTQMKMTPAEAIVASTLNGAHALRLGATKGTIEAGKDADMACFEVADYRELAYWVATNCCAFVVMNGMLQQN